MPIVRRDTLRSQLADALRDEILAGRLAAGQGITVRQLAEQYGVSATPVREALVDLAAQGLLDVEEHRGYTVHAFTAAEFRSLIEARTIVIGGLFRSAGNGVLRPARPEALAAMRRRGEEAERAAKAGDIDVLVHYDLRFWREIGALSGNPYLTEFLDGVRVRCWVFAVPLLRGRADLTTVFWRGQGALVDAIEQRDPAAVESIVRAYNLHSLELIDRLTGAESRPDHYAGPAPDTEPG
ncbi:GntR family transcriptional regulator [Streptomyces sp. NPDC051940]|uniref:GntR family transcriptional regulator n=1 Tax=Streptomyces sp. NPDC051940 TaxID=3155675 RepID=UPI0034277A26